MKCREIKYFLLGSENPDQPPAGVQAHLAVCTACQEWQSRLVQIETNLPFLPFPQSAGRNALLKRILAEPTVSAKPSLAVVGQAFQPDAQPTSPRTIAIADHTRPSRVRAALTALRSMEPGLRRFAAGGLAAALLLAVLSWLVLRLPHQPIQVVIHARPDPDPLLASILERDLRLAEAEKAQERVLALADLAEDLSQEVKALASKPEAKDLLPALVKNYRQVVVNGLVEVANDLTPANRNEILNAVGNRLHRDGREAQELAGTPNVPDSSKKPLQDLGQIAKDADAKLRSMRIEAAGNTSVTTVAVRKERR